jgi:hypothetical protein
MVQSNEWNLADPISVVSPQALDACRADADESYLLVSSLAVPPLSQPDRLVSPHGYVPVDEGVVLRCGFAR